MELPDREVCYRALRSRDPETCRANWSICPVRAVGLGDGSNPVGVVVPCHRVIGANGSLTGYGGGIERKSWLLEHEASAPTMKLRRQALFWEA
jgi:O-6-methylguanine DNA methyltransferase